MEVPPGSTRWRFHQVEVPPGSTRWRFHQVLAGEGPTRFYQVLPGSTRFHRVEVPPGSTRFHQVEVPPGGGSIGRRFHQVLPGSTRRRFSRAEAPTFQQRDGVLLPGDHADVVLDGGGDQTLEDGHVPPHGTLVCNPDRVRLPEHWRTGRTGRGGGVKGWC